VGSQADCAQAVMPGGCSSQGLLIKKRSKKQELLGHFLIGFCAIYYPENASNSSKNALPAQSAQATAACQRVFLMFFRLICGA
jgi:hypothetical protein